jgi:hypothetical protein
MKSITPTLDNSFIRKYRFLGGFSHESGEELTNKAPSSGVVLSY